MSTQPIDTNCMTLTRFVLSEQKKYPTAVSIFLFSIKHIFCENDRCKNICQQVGNLSQLLVSIQSAVKAISAAVRRAGIADIFGQAGNTNVQGEAVKKLDVLSNELFINMLTSSLTCCTLVSEENETVIEVDDYHRGKYIVSIVTSA